MTISGLVGRVSLVTGAAGGIGGAIARALAANGAVVAATDQDADRLAVLAKDMTKDGLPVETFPMDVSSTADVERVVDQIETDLGPVHFLVNAAGTLRLGEARSLTDEDWTATFAANATGVFVVSRAVVNRMVARESGAIVTLVSNAAGTARVEMAAYSASKAAASMFTKCLGLEVARYGIRCNLVAPGSTDTPMLRTLWGDGGGPRSSIDGVPSAFRVGIPLGRLASPSDIAPAVLFLLSDESSHITMHSLTVDGGAALGL